MKSHQKKTNQIWLILLKVVFSKCICCWNLCFFIFPNYISKLRIYVIILWNLFLSFFGDILFSYIWFLHSLCHIWCLKSILFLVLVRKIGQILYISLWLILTNMSWIIARIIFFFHVIQKTSINLFFIIYICPLFQFRIDFFFSLDCFLCIIEFCHCCW